MKLHAKCNPPDIYEIQVSNPSPEPIIPPASQAYIPGLGLGHSNYATSTTTTVATTTTTTSTSTFFTHQPHMSSGVDQPNEITQCHSPDQTLRYESYSEPSSDSSTGDSSPENSDNPTSEEEPDIVDSSLFISKKPTRSPPTKKNKDKSPSFNPADLSTRLFIPSVFIYTPKVKKTIDLIQAQIKPSPLFKIHPNTLECIPLFTQMHKSILTLLLAEGIEHHTLNSKENRPAKIAIKYIPTDISHAEIAAELDQNHLSFHSISRIMQTRNGKKTPSNILIITTNQQTVPHFKDLKAICNILITVEDYVRKDIPQCHRCQGFGHSSQLCRRTRKCVKCGDAHADAPCEAVACKCANCGSGHPASYRGCPVYLDTRARYYSNSILNPNSTTLSNSSKSIHPVYQLTPVVRPTPCGTQPIRTTSPSSIAPQRLVNPPPSEQPPPLSQAPSTILPPNAELSPAVKNQPPNTDANIVQSILEFIKAINIPNIIQIIQNTISKIISAPSLIDKLIILLESVSSIFT